jgi:hypothetical protein
MATTRQSATIGQLPETSPGSPQLVHRLLQQAPKDDSRSPVHYSAESLSVGVVDGSAWASEYVPASKASQE